MGDGESSQVTRVVTFFFAVPDFNFVLIKWLSKLF